MARVRQDGIGLADGLHYLKFLGRLHASLKPEWYFEVGTQTGASLRLSDSKSISVDPQYDVRHELIGSKPELYLIQDTSDNFFASNRLSALDVTIDLAFLDGMHLMEYLLRDFINTERHCTSEGVIVMHDCVPWNSDTTERQRITREWTGDVWKIVPILQAYRPDLDIEIVDCAPSGLVIVSGLDPENTMLSDSYEEIVARYQELKFAEYRPEKYFGEINIIPAEQSRWISACPQFLANGWERNPHIAIKVAAPNREVLPAWGDYFFALGLAKAFSRLGYRTTIDPIDEWYVDTQPGGIDIVLRGRADFGKQPGRTCIFWAISKGVRPINYNQADHVFWASGLMYEKAAAGDMAEKSTLLPQAFDSEIMRPRTSLRGDGMVFVGRKRSGFERTAVTYAARSGHDLKVWGPGWENTEQGQFLCGDRLDNTRLPEVYAQTDIVLNDHTPQMKENGQTSNRIFDTLACGSVPISDSVNWLPQEFRDYVYLYDDEDSFNEALTAAVSETDEKRRKRLEFAEFMREQHSFAARARSILNVVDALVQKDDQKNAYGADA